MKDINPILETIEVLREQLRNAFFEARTGDELTDVLAAVEGVADIARHLRDGQGFSAESRLGIAGRLRDIADGIHKDGPVAFEGPQTGYRVRVEAAATVTTYDYDRLVEVIGRHRAARLVKRTVIAGRAAHALSADEQRRAGKVRVSARAIKGVG